MFCLPSCSCSTDVFDEQHQESTDSDCLIDHFNEFIVGVHAEEAVRQETDDGVYRRHVQNA